MVEAAGGRSQVTAVMKLHAMHERGSKTVRATVYRVDVSPMHVECVYSGNKCTVLPLARYGRIIWIDKSHPVQSLIRQDGRRINAARLGGMHGMHAFSRDTSCTNHVGHVASTIPCTCEFVHLCVPILDGRIRWTMHVGK